MADIKISALPQANEVWNLNEILPVVDSSFTTTSKRTYGSLFSNHSGGTYTITSTDQTYAVIACGSSSPQTHIRIGGINNAAVISSRGANISSGQMNTIIGSEQSNDSVQPNIQGGQYNTIIGSYGDVRTSGGNHGFISNSRNTSLGGNAYQTIMGTEGGSTNGQFSGTLGSQNSTNDSSYQWFIGTNNVSNYASQFHFVAATQNYTTNSPSMDYNFVGGSSDITNGNSGSIDYAVTLGSKNLQNNHERSVMLGVDSKNSLYSGTTHVDNVHTFRAETFDVIDAGSVSGSIDVDCSLGTIFKFSLTGNTTPNFINVRNGQRFIFIVNNTGTYSVPTATVNGIGSTVYAKNGAINPSNNGYTKYTATYDGTYMFLDEELGFQAV